MCTSSSTPSATRSTTSRKTAPTQTTRYQGNGGVSMGSFFRRVAFALRFGEINPLISNLITRRVADPLRPRRQRAGAAARPVPRLRHRPLSRRHRGQLEWIIDAYTTTDQYPYAQRVDTAQLPTGQRPRGPVQLRAQLGEGRRRRLRRRRHLLRRRPEGSAHPYELSIGFLDVP